MARENANRGRSGPRKEKPPTPMDTLKLEVAQELGLLDKVRSSGWGMLTAAETGRIGGLMTHRMRKKAQGADQGAGGEAARP